MELRSSINGCSSPPCDFMTSYTLTGSKIFKLSFLHEYCTKNFQIFLYQVMHQGQQNKPIKKIYYFFSSSVTLDKQQPSVDRYLSFGGIAIMTNEPISEIEPHFARLYGELL